MFTIKELSTLGADIYAIRQLVEMTTKLLYHPNEIPPPSNLEECKNVYRAARSAYFRLEKVVEKLQEVKVKI